MCSTEFSKETQRGWCYWEKTREKVADVLALVQRLNSPLVFQPDCDKLWFVANSLSPCGTPTLQFLWPAHLSGTLVSGSETAIYDSPQLIFYWPNYYNQKIRYKLGLSEGENIHFHTTGNSRTLKDFHAHMNAGAIHDAQLCKRGHGEGRIMHHAG